MDILAINGAMPGNDYGLIKATKIIYSTLQELGFDVSEINLANLQIPFYSGQRTGMTDELISRISKAKGIIFLSSSQGFSPSALMLGFLEYFETAGQALREKNCMIFAVVKSFGERAVSDFFSRFLNQHGAYDPVRICVNAATLSEILSDTASREIIERQVEDFYRVIRQGRKFFIPSEQAGARGLPGLAEALTPEQAETLAESERRRKIPAVEVYKKLDLESFTKRQEDDINDLTRYFAKKNYEPDAGVQISDYEDSLLGTKVDQATGISEPVTPRVKTCRQMTRSLPHYFQPQIAGSIKAVIQLSITGAEKFEGYLQILNNECEYFEGVSETPDVTIISDSNIWSDVMRQKYTAQKAFMIGHLKVRGNFVILTKFDQIFKMI